MTTLFYSALTGSHNTTITNGSDQVMGSGDSVRRDGTGGTTVYDVNTYITGVSGVKVSSASGATTTLRPTTHPSLSGSGTLGSFRFGWADTAAPSVDHWVCRLNNSGGTQQVRMRIGSDGLLRLYDEQGAGGSATPVWTSTALPTSTQCVLRLDFELGVSMRLRIWHGSDYSVAADQDSNNVTLTGTDLSQWFIGNTAANNNGTHLLCGPFEIADSTGFDDDTPSGSAPVISYTETRIVKINATATTDATSYTLTETTASPEAIAITQPSTGVFHIEVATDLANVLTFNLTASGDTEPDDTEVITVDPLSSTGSGLRRYNSSLGASTSISSWV